MWHFHPRLLKGLPLQAYWALPKRHEGFKFSYHPAPKDMFLRNICFCFNFKSASANESVRKARTKASQHCTENIRLSEVSSRSNLPNLSSASPAPSVPPAPSARVAVLRTGKCMAALHMAELDAGQKAPKTKRSPCLRLRGLAFGQVDLPGTVCEKIWGDRDSESSRELGIGGWIRKGRGLGTWGTQATWRLLLFPSH